MRIIEVKFSIHLLSPHLVHSDPLKSPSGEWEDLEGLYIFMLNANTNLPVSFEIASCGFIDPFTYQSIHCKDDIKFIITGQFDHNYGQSTTNKWELDYIQINNAICTDLDSASNEMYWYMSDLLEQEGLAA